MAHQALPLYDIEHAGRYVWVLVDDTSGRETVTYLVEYALFDAPEGWLVNMMVPGHMYRLELPETTALAAHTIAVEDLVKAHV